ncbi:MAG: DNA-binding protein [Sulfurovaceae bacterium]|nr:DNA-binding protein [Sulfurovaceae bacterium]
MNNTIEIGKVNRLRVARDTDYGLYLVSGNFDEILLPNTYVVDKEMPIGSIIEVFVYTDSEDRLVASTKYPYAMLGEFGYFTVVDYKQYGAFVNWGLPKDLFVPLSQQKVYFHIGEKYILRVCLDKETGRLYGTQKIGKWLSYKPKDLVKNQKVNILVFSKTPLGYKVIVENLYEGMLFDNEIFESLSIGDKKEAYIKNIRKDGKLDLILHPIGKKSTADVFESKVLNTLQVHNGFVNINSKSTAEEIKKIFGLSKKSFKRSVTSLIEKSRIKLQENGIKIV